MTDFDLDETEDEEYPSARLTVWLLVSIWFMFWRNIFQSFMQYWDDNANAFVAHSNWKSQRKTFADSVTADIAKL